MTYAEKPIAKLFNILKKTRKKDIYKDSSNHLPKSPPVASPPDEPRTPIDEIIIRITVILLTLISVSGIVTDKWNSTFPNHTVDSILPFLGNTIAFLFPN